MSLSELKCPNGEVSLEDRGVIKWTKTLVGHRIHIRCPYAANDEALFAEKDCLPKNITSTKNNQSVTVLGMEWGKTRYDQCPSPPFSRRLQLIKSNVTVRKLTSINSMNIVQF